MANKPATGRLDAVVGEMEDIPAPTASMLGAKTVACRLAGAQAQGLRALFNGGVSCNSLPSSQVSRDLEALEETVVLGWQIGRTAFC